MRFWWVNQNQTYRHEIAGRYLWSPKRKANGHMNPYYEFMREVAPGDLVFSFAGTRIRAYGIATSHAYEAPKPEEFGSTGRYWEEIGWRVDVTFHELDIVFRPVDWIEALRPLLPARYSPLLHDGRGSQSIYLTALPRAFALRLADLIGKDVAAIARVEATAYPEPAGPNMELTVWEEHLRGTIESDTLLTTTDREMLVVARRGQGLFRERVQEYEQRCRITGVDRPEHLRASHCKPWRDSSNAERLDGDNGLLLTPSIDHLFDRGFISFRDDGRLLVSPVAHVTSLERMGVETLRSVDTGPFRHEQLRYLEYHRDEVFLASRVRME
jgi:hypothetical protein